MKRATFVSFLLVSSWMCPDTANALFETKATFGSFYDKGWSEVLIWGGVGDTRRGRSRGRPYSSREVRQARS